MKLLSLYNRILFRIHLACCFLLISSTVFSQQTLRTNLFVVAANGSKTLMDGNMTIYDDIYCNCVNWQDALKMTNPGSNWGLLRSGAKLAVERRNFIPDTDTSYIWMWNLQQLNYSVQITGSNLAKTDRIAFVIDNYTNLTTSINLGDTTYFNFSVDSNTRSSAQNRFAIIFEKKAPVPPSLIFTSIKLLRKEALINVAFAVDNEKAVTFYKIQHSQDSINFKDVLSISPKNLGGSEIYNEDAGKLNVGANFYRIKATDALGRITFSNVAKMLIPVAESSMSIYPNPATSRQLFLNIHP